MKKYTAYKKSIQICIGFLFLATYATGQDVKRIQQLFNQNNLSQAREAIDSFTNSNTESAEAYLLKAFIYNALDKNESSRYLVADGKMEAFIALSKATELDKSYVDKQLKPGHYLLPKELYSNYTNEGLTHYNAGVERNDKNSFTEALLHFKKAGSINQFMYNNGWSLQALDTLNLFYSAKSAINAANETDALIFTKKIVDDKILNPAFSKGYEGIYQWLAYYYKTKKDGELFDKYSYEGAKQFPQSIYFSLLQIDWLRQQNDYVNMFAFYQDIFKKQPGNPKYVLAYLNDIFIYVFKNKEAVEAKSNYADTLQKGLLKYLQHNPSATEARLLLAKVYNNQASQALYESTLRSTTNAKVLNTYKAKYKNLLLAANKQLIAIIKNKQSQANANLYNEALQLLKGNKEILRLVNRTKG
jgi:hypothetical protein